MRTRIECLARIVGIVVRHRDHGIDLARAHVEHDAGGGIRLELVARRDQFVAQRMLHADVGRELHRLLLAISGKAGTVEVSETVAIEPFLDAGDALIVDIDVADQVGDLVAVRIDAFVLRQEADARNTEPVHFHLLGRRDIALEPGEAAPRAEAVAHLAAVEVRHHAGEKLGRLVRVNDAARLRKQRRRLEVGCQDFAVAIDDVGPGGRERVLAAAAHGVGIRDHRIEHEAYRDDPIDKSEPERSGAKPGLGLRRTVDLLAVEQRLHEPAPPRHGRRRRRSWIGRRAHPVTLSPSRSWTTQREAGRRHGSARSRSHCQSIVRCRWSRLWQHRRLVAAAAPAGDRMARSEADPWA